MSGMGRCLLKLLNIQEYVFFIVRIIPCHGVQRTGVEALVFLSLSGALMQVLRKASAEATPDPFRILVIEWVRLGIV